MKHEPVPTVRVADDGPRGYRIINAADFDPTAHRAWPLVEEEAAPAEPKKATAKKA